jgi:hypothetical protein
MSSAAQGPVQVLPHVEPDNHHQHRHAQPTGEQKQPRSDSQQQQQQQQQQQRRPLRTPPTAVCCRTPGAARAEAGAPRGYTTWGHAATAAPPEPARTCSSSNSTGSGNGSSSGGSRSAAHGTAGTIGECW